ncbi:hypothetical protein [Sphingomonas endolithica]|uniref:phage terminase large subunit family protein n=1 Tax=Sphingomonas endolithica TaxID=2972485 RepID=UPI0021AFD241|nr:hypothetical protein [Sphingomonas sp. ZFBP2030]
MLQRMVDEPDTIQIGGASGLNPHVGEAWVRAMRRHFAGGRLEAQEIDGVLAADLAGALWPAGLIAACRGGMPAPGALVRVVVGVDPPASAGGVCGIVVCGIDEAGIGHVLADRSAGGLSPEGWARSVVATTEAYGPDRVVVETNQGGEMVGAVLRSVDVRLPIRAVTATRGKIARAEPVAALFETGQVRLCGVFAELETELAGMVVGGYEGPGRSPDRADAMVWALWALMLERGGPPRVRET